MRRSVAIAAALGFAASTFAQDATVPEARWHHVHINARDPQASIEFYASKFDCEKARYQDRTDAVWAQQSWLLFEKVAHAPPHEIVSPIWHIGWGAEDMKATYDKQIASGTKFETPLTDISGLVGLPENSGAFFFAYVLGPDGELIELNTANHHHFGHLHLLSADPVAAADWYHRRLGIAVRGKSTRERVYNGFPVSPSATLQSGNVNIIIFPMGYAKAQWPQLWKDRSHFETSRGRAIDHVAFSVDNLDETLQRLRSAGVKMLDEPRSILGVRSAMIEGPDRIAIEIVEGHATKP
jgi:catechol 2,3-dioxygenase-like lactoylglutathione lyase family enzyme